jgi:hypothetical protein
MRAYALGVLFLGSISLAGCAAVFRPSKDTILVDSTPAGADAKNADRAIGHTPTEVQVERKRSTEITLTKPGYEVTTIVPKRHINVAWISLDVLTCVFPVALCIPLLVDALTGAWYDVDNYHATMKPGGAPGSAPSGTAVASTTPGPAPTTVTATPSGPPPDMSESERKATARAAYLEGVKLQEAGSCPEALSRFEAAQKFYSAPTHLLHLGQCQAATGKLVEASESYESLVRTPLTKDSPEAFRQAQEEGKKDLASIRPRIPTLRVQTIPAANTLSSLVVKLNGNAIPNEVLGIARPINPGKYKITVWAAGYREASSEAEVGEGSAKNVELKLVK